MAMFGRGMLGSLTVPEKRYSSMSEKGPDCHFVGVSVRYLVTLGVVVLEADLELNGL